VPKDQSNTLHPKCVKLHATLAQLSEFLALLLPQIEHNFWIFNFLGGLSILIVIACNGNSILIFNSATDVFQLVSFLLASLQESYE